MSPAPPKRILIAPLDWGLGHTTRCIPVIRHLLAQRHEVIFAGNARQQAIISTRFPQIRLLTLKGYNVRYSRRALMFTLLWQMPRLLRIIAAEHQWLRRIVAEEGIDGVISDNRYGLWHPHIPAVILTHQPGMLTGFGLRANAIVRRLHYRYLARFREVWIPDVAGAANLGGRLSHPPRLPRSAQYIGWLSQLSPALRNAAEQHLLILLSGPEPQRTILADELWAQACTLHRPIVFVEGATGVKRRACPAHIRHYGQVDAVTLVPLIQSASAVVCRSGYSTLMDLALLGKMAVLIPTPGQTEQEYLARSLAARGIFYAAAQKGFSLKSMLEKAQDISGNSFPEQDTHRQFIPVLDNWLCTL